MGKQPPMAAGSTQIAAPAGERLDSWKEISAYLKRDPRTLQRWEKKEGLPVHRHVHESQSSVYAYTSELDAWLASRTVSNGNGPASGAESLSRHGRLFWPGLAASAALLIVIVFVIFRRGTPTPQPAPSFHQVWKAEEV